ncbi:MAG: cysteine desulfurase family protein [Phycisphaerales bacterium JB050]
MIHLDHNATTRPCDEAISAAEAAMRECWHNPSSVHRAGQAARQMVDRARGQVASLLGVKARDLTFTSSATEAIDFAHRGVMTLAAPAGKPVILTTAIEHEAVRDICAALAEPMDRGGVGAEVVHVPVTVEGVVDLDALARLLDEHDGRIGLVSVQWANNETGAVQPVGAIGALCRDREVLFFCDATQWVGKMPIVLDQPRSPFGGEPMARPEEAVRIDLLCLSGHKFHGIKGAGVLYCDRSVRLKPQILGAQEKGRRGGTEPVPAIAAMGAAAEVAQEWLRDASHRQRIAEMRDRLEQTLIERVEGAHRNGPSEPGSRLWNTTNIAFPGCEAEALLLQFSERGLAASAGAACSSGSLDPSPVLLSMGVPEVSAHGSIRFSLSRETTDAEIDEAIEIVTRCVQRVRRAGASAT